MVVMIWKDNFAIIDSYPEDNIYKTVMYTESEIIDGDPPYFSDAEDAFKDKDNDYDTQNEILLANYTWIEVDSEDEAYRWLIKESFNV